MDLGMTKNFTERERKSSNRFGIGGSSRNKTSVTNTFCYHKDF